MFDFKMRGVIPPMITPFDEYGKLDEKSLITLVEFLSERVDGLFICGSYGCGPLMSLDERKRVAEIVKKHVSNNVAVVVHTGTTNAKDTIDLSLHAQEIGCDAISAVGPYYYEYKDLDLLEYYTSILKEVKDIPLYLYHNPKFQGYITNIDVIRKLKDAGLSGIKDATFDIMMYATYARELMDEDFDVALGTEAMWISAKALGCKAFIPGLGNVFPELCKDMWIQSMTGEQDKALKLQFLINQLRDVMYFTRSTQLAIYAMADIRGIIKSYPRAPFIAATEKEKAKIKSGLVELGVL